MVGPIRASSPLYAKTTTEHDNMVETWLILGCWPSKAFSEIFSLYESESEIYDKQSEQDVLSTCYRFGSIDMRI